MKVTLGEHDTASTLESTTLRIRAKPYRFNKHWSYQFDGSQGAWYDFALVELSQPVNFSQHPHIRPVCLPEQGELDYDQEVATVSGWGLQNVDYKLYKDQGLLKGVGYGRAEKLKKLDVRWKIEYLSSNINTRVFCFLDNFIFTEIIFFLFKDSSTTIISENEEFFVEYILVFSEEDN